MWSAERAGHFSELAHCSQVLELCGTAWDRDGGCAPLVSFPSSSFIHNLLQVACQQEGGPDDDGKWSVAAEVEGRPRGLGAVRTGVLAPLKLHSGPAPLMAVGEVGASLGLRGSGFSVCLVPCSASSQTNKSGGWVVMRQLRTLHLPSLEQPM